MSRKSIAILKTAARGLEPVTDQRQAALLKASKLRSAVLNGVSSTNAAADVSCFSRLVRSKLRARLRCPELVEDACQESFLRVLAYFRAGQVLNNPAALPGFIHSVCRNVSLEFLRSHTRHSQLPENALDPIDDAPSPELQTALNERRQLLSQVLVQLSERDQRLLRRIFLDEEDNDVVCNELHINPANLRCVLHRARTRFKAIAFQTMTAPEIMMLVGADARRGGGSAHVRARSRVQRPEGPYPSYDRVRCLPVRLGHQQNAA